MLFFPVIYASELISIYPVCGTGLMCRSFSISIIHDFKTCLDINNVGSMSQALFAKNNPAYDPIEAARWQADQVSVISLMNFSGRIAIGTFPSDFQLLKPLTTLHAGIVSDFAKSKFDYPRSYLILLVAFLVFISQVAAANIDDVRQLWISSALLGLGYGSVFSLLPQVAIEWFGICLSFPPFSSWL